MRRAWLAAFLLLPAVVAAHPLAPALLELRETGAHAYDVLWRTSVARVQRADVAPELPAHCRDTQPPAVTSEEGALALRWAVRCEGGLAGHAVAVSGLEQSGINVIVRVAPAGSEPFTALLDAAQPQLTVPAASVPPAAFGAYLALGFDHLLLGIDHVLFVAGLVLLLFGQLRQLVLTATAFTLGHSVTLALAALGVMRVSSALMELGIALSILVLAVELARGDPRSLLRRHPALMAGGFGLLHGLGFAGALAEVGLPQTQIPLALLAFNLGIELGQLAVIAGLLALAAVWRRAPLGVAAVPRVASVYAIGALAAYWVFERAAVLFG